MFTPMRNIDVGNWALYGAELKMKAFESPSLLQVE